jgi:hypothetical protein
MGNALALIALLLQYSDKITQIGALLTKANTEGRDVSDTELDALFADDDAAKARFDALIKAAGGGTLP